MTRERVIHAARRSRWWFVAAFVLFALSVPAFFDLRALLVGLGVVCAALGAVTAAYTWAAEEAADAPPVRRD